MNRRACPGCSEQSETVITALANTFPHPLSRDRFNLLECARCRTAFLDEMPTDEDFIRMYVEADQFSGDQYRDEAERSALGFYKEAVKAMVAITNIDQENVLRILEIGAGRAWICMAAKALKINSMTVAQDVTSECAMECSWVDEYIVGEIDDPRIDQLAPFDLISLTHVIEHLPNPAASLVRARKLLSPSGQVYITAPHQPAPWTTDRSVQSWPIWAYNHTPAHLQYFTKSGLSFCAAQAGLQLQRWQLHEEGSSFEALLTL